MNFKILTVIELRKLVEKSVIDRGIVMVLDSLDPHYYIEVEYTPKRLKLVHAQDRVFIPLMPSSIVHSIFAIADKLQMQ